LRLAAASSGARPSQEPRSHQSAATLTERQRDPDQPKKLSNRSSTIKQDTWAFKEPRKIPAQKTSASKAP